MFYLLRNSKPEKNLSAIWLQTNIILIFFLIPTISMCVYICICNYPSWKTDNLVYVEEYGKVKDKQINILGA